MKTLNSTSAHWNVIGQKLHSSPSTKEVDLRFLLEKF